MCFGSTQMVVNTQQMRFGTCVTNPATRDPTVTASTLATLNLLSGGRMDLGIGRGDSAQRVLNRKPTTVAALREATVLIKELASGRAAQIEGNEVRLPWAQPYEVPAWVAAYGPKVLNLAGQVADGVILQLVSDLCQKRGRRGGARFQPN
jgi:alkanesulfonate monooxygenase SsuD/methylene tetrahydromethanopterin reductase-like flavin-dependent oxidoreductase (luciferase family)